MSSDPNFRPAPDLERVDIRYDDSAGTLVVAYRFYARADEADAGRWSIGVTLDQCLGREDGPPQGSASLHHHIDPETDAVSYSASASRYGRFENAEGTVTVGPDGRTIGVSYSEAFLAGNDWRCISNWSANPDSFADFYFQGYEPRVPPPAHSPCTKPLREDQVGWRVHAPAQVAAGRMITFSLKPNGSTESSNPDGARATVTSLGASPLYEPFVDQVSHTAEWSFWTALNDPSFKIEAAYADNQEGPDAETWDACRRGATPDTVRVIKGYPATVDRVAGASAAYFNIPKEQDCPHTRYGAVVIAITGGGTKRSATLTDPCEGRWRSRKTLSGRGWRARLRADNDEHSIEVRLPGYATKSRSFTYRIRAHGKTLKSGRFSILRIHSPSRRLWRGTDAFFNFCIQDNRRIWRENGRYYCVLPGGTHTSVRFR